LVDHAIFPLEMKPETFFFSTEAVLLRHGGDSHSMVFIEFALEAQVHRPD
jgi:hypothetical protein